MTKEKRIYQIDLFRFLAALSVLLFHYLFRGFAADNLSILEFNQLGEYFKYGYLGVDLFFMISGFVIMLSIKHGSATRFIIARIVRLYPAFWFCVLLTFSVILFFGAPRFDVSIKQLLVNLTMFQNFVNVEPIDEVYWTLYVEMKFYILIGIYLAVNKVRKIGINKVIVVWLALSIAYVFVDVLFDELFIARVINYFLILNWSSYFIAGIIYSQIFKEGLKLKHGILLLICLLLSCYHVLGSIIEFQAHYNIVFSKHIIWSIITIFYFAMLLVSTKRLSFMNSPKLLTLGIISYPLYLIHQMIGFIIFNNSGTTVNKYVLVVSTVFIMIIAAYFISKKIEKSGSAVLKNKLNQFAEKYKLLD